MYSLKKIWLFVAILILGNHLGCDAPQSQDAKRTTPQQTNASAATSNDVPILNAEDHAHTPGAHGGILVSLGRDSYHIEAIVESTGTVRLYTLGKEETRVIDIEMQSLKGFVRISGDNQSHTIEFSAERQNGDAENRTSQFVATLPETMRGKDIEITIPNIVISGERFRLAFTTHSGDPHSEMPSKVNDSAERDLYLTPGGQYTAADIAANKNMTATEKFWGIKSAHDMFPKSGDRTCPITETKANPKFAWIVGGREYLFCCPPCVDEFVRMAKASQDVLPSPESYTKQ